MNQQQQKRLYHATTEKTIDFRFQKIDYGTEFAFIKFSWMNSKFSQHSHTHRLNLNCTEQNRK